MGDGLIQGGLVKERGASQAPLIGANICRCASLGKKSNATLFYLGYLGPMFP